MWKGLLWKNRRLKGWKTNRLSAIRRHGLVALACCILASRGAASAASHYQRTNLVSDLNGKAKTLDSKLVNPWGIARSPNSPWWVSDNGSGSSTLYNGIGQPFPVGNALIVTIPPPPGETGTSAPTGVVFNGSSDFAVTPGNPARFIFVTEDGTISAWNGSVDMHNAMVKVSNPSVAVYKGVTIAMNGSVNYLYVANFRGETVDVFDTNFAPFTFSATAFKDPNLPAGFAPFNVQNINGNVVVTFAKQDAEKHDDVAGAGLGFVDIFDPVGNLLMSLQSGPWLDAPWGVVMAPADFGRFSHRLLIGNFGSGRIAAFDAQTGKFRGLLKGRRGHPIQIDGLWGLGFGNGGAAGPQNTLFFAAGIDDEQHGLFGSITSIARGGDHDDRDDDDDDDKDDN